jgi:hypothetical protein
VIEVGDGACFAFETIGEPALGKLDRDQPAEGVPRAFHTSPIPPAPMGAINS